MRWLMVTLAAGLVGCGSAPPPAEAPAAAAEARGEAQHGGMLYAGEKFVAQVNRGALALASIEIEAQAPCVRDGVTVLPVHAHAERSTLARIGGEGSLDGTVWLDVDSRLPLASHASVVTPRRSYDLSLDVRHPGYRYVYQREGKSSRKRTVLVPNEMTVYEGLSAVAALRSWSRALGARDTMHVLIGRRMWRVNFHVAERETVHVGGANTDAVRIDGTARRLYPRTLRAGRTLRQWTLWVSDDEHRMPLQARLALRKETIELELTDYQFAAPPACDASDGSGCSVRRCR